jgi:hypothetical protein
MNMKTETSTVRTVAATEVAQKKTGLFGRLLEKAGSWIKPKGVAVVDAKVLQEKPEWENAQKIDLSELEKLPKNFKAPIKVEEIRLNYDADKVGGIAQDKALLESLPATPVKVEFTINTQQIFNLLQNEPEKLTPEMAHLIAGNRSNVSRGLSDKALFGAIQRLEKKFGPEKLDKVDSEVKNILLDRLSKSDNPKIWAQTKTLKTFLAFSKYEEQIVDEKQSTSSTKEKTTKALEQEMAKLKSEIAKPAELVAIVGKSKLNIDKIADLVLQQNLKYIKQRSSIGLGYRPHLVEPGIRNSFNQLFSSIKDDSIKQALIQVALRSLQRLETKFENTGTEAAKNYNRITKLNEGSQERLLYATALMERNSGIDSSSKVVAIKKLAS